MKCLGNERLGPVLADASENLAWWLLPAGLSGELDHVQQLTMRPPGWSLKCPPVLFAIDDRLWLERPDGSGRLTNPAALGAAMRQLLPAEALG
jgi:hypothetical protein